MGSTLILMLAYAMSIGLSDEPKKPPVKLHPVESNLIERTNIERARYGLPPLKLDMALLRSAREHADWMSDVESLTHTNRPVAENIAMGQHRCSEAIRSWMNSPGHRANILNPSYTRIGVAAYRSANGTAYWCQQFLH